MVADFAVETVKGRKLAFGHLEETLLQHIIVSLLRPEVGISSLHTVERQYRSAGIFIAQLQPNPSLFRIPVLEDPVAKLGIAAGFHLVDIRENDLIAHNKVCHIPHLMYSYTITDIATDDLGIV